MNISNIVRPSHSQHSTLGYTNVNDLNAIRNEILSMIRKDKEDYEDNSFKLTLIFYLFPNILCYLLVHPKMQIKEQEFTMIWLSFPKDNGISIRKLLYHESVIEKPLEMNLGLEAEL